MTTLRIAPETIFSDPAYSSLGEQTKQEIENLLVALGWFQKELSTAQKLSNEYLKIYRASQQSFAPGLRWLVTESSKYEQAANSVSD